MNHPITPDPTGKPSQVQHKRKRSTGGHVRGHSTAPDATGKPARPVKKPAKPYKDFPLFPHASGRWAKKILGRMVYFGKWDDWQAALDKYLEQKDDLHAGRTPRVSVEGVTVKNLLDRFLTSKLRLRDAGEITPRTFGEYHAVCDQIAAAFGLRRLVIDLRADDFEALRADLAKRLGPVALGNTVQRIRTVFKYAYDSDLIDRPVKFGTVFKRPSRKVLRKVRNERGPRMFTAEELRKILDTADSQMKAMVLLGINVGFGNSDVGTLPQSALDLEGGWVTYPRPKTHVRRRAALWPETVDAIREALAHRPKPKDTADDGLVFLTKYGHRWFTGTPNNPLSHEMAKLLAEAGVEGKRRNFYALRHGFETVGGASLDQVAVDFVMGHAADDGDMASVYREEIDDSRLLAVARHVHDWLFPPAGKAKKPGRGTDKPASKVRHTGRNDTPVDRHQDDEERPALRLFAG